MESSSIGDKERRELRKLVEQIKSESGCVLVLGPRVAVRVNDPDRRPHDELLAVELLASLNDAPDSSVSLRQAADLHFRRNNDPLDLQLSAQEFYAHEKNSTTEFHRHLAQLPLTLCISASPDSLMFNAFKSVGKRPQTAYYNFRARGRSRQPAIADPTVEQPLIYYLFGYYENYASLVLTEGDLIDYLVKIIRNDASVPDASVPDNVRRFLSNPYASFLFLGFGFQNWYLRVLLNVLDAYGHRFKSVAFEDSRFVDAPENRPAIAFYEDRLIEFRRLNWEPFAAQLLQSYRESLPPPRAENASAPMSPDARAPCAFLSYASEDLEIVEHLGEQLDANGIKVWQDKRNLRGGDNWNEVLLTVIKDEEKIHYVIVVNSTAMFMATRGIFRRELEAALEVQIDMGEFAGQRLRFIIPVRIDDSPLLHSLEKIQAIDLRDPVGITQLVTSITEDWKKREKLKMRQRADA